MPELVLKGHKVVGGSAEGEALVTRDCISFMGSVNPNTGVITEKGHQLEGKNISNKILIYPSGKGSTGGSYMLYDMAQRGTAPKAIVNIRAEAVTAIGAIMGEIPMVDRVEKNPLEVLNTGDYVRIEADKGLVVVLRRR